MDESYFIDTLNDSSYVIFSMDTKLNVIFSNNLAKKVFKFDDDQISNTINPLDIDVNFVIQNYSRLKSKEKIYITEFSFSNQSSFKPSSYIIGILDNEGNLSGFNVFLKPVKSSPVDFDKLSNSKRRTYDQIRMLILYSLNERRKTINQVAKDIGVNWKTVENHLSYLSSKKMIQEIFASEYVRIFEMTQKGRLCFEASVNPSYNNMIKSQNFSSSLHLVEPDELNYDEGKVSESDIGSGVSDNDNQEISLPLQSYISPEGNMRGERE